MNLRSERVPFCEDDIDDVEVDLEMELIPDEFCEIETPTARKRDRILEKRRKLYWFCNETFGRISSSYDDCCGVLWKSALPDIPCWHKCWSSL